MTGVETTVNRKPSILSETGKTSPLTDLSSPSPPYIKPDSGYESDTPSDGATVGKTALSHRSQQQDNTESTFDQHEKASSLLQLYDTSDLSELDSEAETEKMMSPNATPKRSKLAAISKVKQERTVDEVIRQRLDEIDNDADEANGDDAADDNTLIKEDVIDELQSDKDADLVVDTNGDGMGKVVEDMRKSEDAESSVFSEVETSTTVPSSNGNGREKNNNKRRRQDDSQDSVKRPKTESAEEEQEEGDNAGEQDSQVAPAATTEHEAENEGEDEEDEDEDEEEELTEEQKLEKQREAEEEAEKQRLRKEAIEYLTEIEIDFAKLRDRLYEDKMARFKSELEMCLNGTHPELQTVYGKIDAHRTEKINLSNLNAKYKRDCINRQIRAQRTAVHQQFFKKTSDFRTTYIREIMHNWDEINKERRELGMELFPNYSYKVPEYVDEALMQRAQVNQEVSNLVGLQMYYGFPTAPRLSFELDNKIVEDDIKEMNAPLTFPSPTPEEQV